VPSGKAFPARVKEFIIETRRDAPQFTYAEIALMVKAELETSIDKTTVGKILQRAGLGGKAKEDTVRRQVNRRMVGASRNVDVNQTEVNLVELRAILQRWHDEVQQFYQEWALGRALEKVAPSEDNFKGFWPEAQTTQSRPTAEDFYGDTLLEKYASMEDLTIQFLAVQGEPLFSLLIQQIGHSDISEAKKTWEEATLKYAEALRSWYFQVSTSADYIMRAWPLPTDSTLAKEILNSDIAHSRLRLVLQWRALSKIIACDLLVQEFGRRESPTHAIHGILELRSLREEARSVLTWEFTIFQDVLLDEEMLPPIFEAFPELQNILDGRSSLLDAYDDFWYATQVLLDKLGDSIRDWHGVHQAR